MSRLIPARVRGWFTIGRVTNAAVLLSVAVMLLVLVVALQTLSNTDAQSRSDKLAGCRSEYRADIDAANAAHEAASDLVALLELDILNAAFTGQDPSALLAQIAAAHATLEAAARVVASANEQNSTAVALSRADPDAFLDGCAAIGGERTLELAPLDTTTTTTTTAPAAAPATTTSSSLRTATTRRPTTTSTTTTTSSSPPSSSAPPSSLNPVVVPPSQQPTLLGQTIAEICAIAPTEQLCP